MRQTADTLSGPRFDGESRPPRSLTHEFAVMMRRLEGIPPVRFHDLWHSHATQLLAAGPRPKIAQKQLGHSTIAFTVVIYSQVTVQMHSDAAAQLDAAYKA